MSPTNWSSGFFALTAWACLAHGPLAVAQAAGPDEPAEASKAREPVFPGLGNQGRKVTTADPEAQRYFDQGLGFLYAFNHDEALRSFRQAVALDPGCAMGWWGIATANGPHINNPAVPDGRNAEAIEALRRARERIDAATPAERALIEAASKRYGEIPPEGRKAFDEGYAAAMAEAWEAHPSDPDVGALYAEALMDLRPWDLWTIGGEPRPGTERVLAVLERVLAIRPDHPLACHLYIHAVEASPHPEKAIAAADRLRQLQPGLSHLVHMPSHIDVRLGRWAEAALTNERAIEADRAYRSARPSQGFYWLYMLHNRHMLAYAALMRGEGAKAIGAVDAMIAELPIDWARENAPIADAYFAMPIEVRMRFGRWDEILAAPEPEATFPIARALRLAARGVAFAANGRVDEARGEQSRFAEARALVGADARVGNSPAAVVLDVAEHQLAGELLYREGDEAAAIEALRKAVDAEDALNYDEPPDWIVPVRHALGAALLKSGRAAEAEAVYREDLRRLPENGWSLFGLMKALKAQGREDEAKAVESRWGAIWKDADVRLTSSCLCLPGL